MKVGIKKGSVFKIILKAALVLISNMYIYNAKKFKNVNFKKGIGILKKVTKQGEAVCI